MSTGTTNQPAERDLIIRVSPCYGWADYLGTAAQLQSEGLIPSGFEWPRASSEKIWSANGLEYRLRRERPRGHKGSWIDLDSWNLTTFASGYDANWVDRRAIDRKARELRDEIHRLAPAGAREWRAFGARCWAASQDKAFQDFKALFVPERKRPGRKPKDTQGGQQ